MTMKSRVIASMCVVGGVFTISATAANTAEAADRARVTFYDDGVKLRGESERSLPKSSFATDASPLELFALPGETLGLQLVIDADEKLEGVHAEVAMDDGPNADPASAVAVTSYAQHFVRVARPSGNDRYPGSLAFSASAAPPRDAFVGLVADALLPRPLSLEARARGALWIDISVSEDAKPGLTTGTLLVASQQGSVAQRAVRLRVGSRKLPYAAAKVTVFYEPRTLDRRMGSRAAERSLRHVVHAHHVSAMPERIDPESIDLDLEALTGALYTRAHGYRGPGQNVGEGVYAIGSYGSLGDASEQKLRVVERFVERIRERGALEQTDVFLYAVDENCESPRAKQWLKMLARSGSRDVSQLRVGVTCEARPSRQDATLAIVPASHYDPETARDGKARGKAVWTYNGIRPHAGPMMLDVPAVDLRANAWIAMRYDVSRWFYWESIFWLDDNRGGKGGREGWDPFEASETFHNADGDYAMGDGLLLYPGTQPAPMTDFGEQAIYPSVRLKNIRRGVLDAGYVALAREKDRDRTDAVVGRMIPTALALVRERDRVSWTDDADTWRAARSELFAIIEGPVVASRASSASSANRFRYATALAAIFVLAGLTALVTMRRKTKRTPS